ncbi:FYVE, RhoGEF and PH domain-containing protein 2-like [Scleropages formosus]|uniref:FYVE, RhoGEF and PH domain-containing protein 2-like n=1 Tax=Scleropages formosus TaxID=113540 RepID=A0A0P7WHY0_SCLFO|nr:FYVE, RhoGEF and PH domain-containing protein 2-like [Scleropages formosus]
MQKFLVYTEPRGDRDRMRSSLDPAQMCRRDPEGPWKAVLLGFEKANQRGGASCQWRGLQTFRSRASNSRLTQRITPPTQDQEQEEDEKKKQETNNEKLHKIVCELLETEKGYVRRLHLLDQGFFSALLAEARAAGSFPEEVVRHIFSNISSIHQFHSGFLLPELQRRISDWNQNPRIGDVLQKVAPFLKMYGEYIKGFDRAMELINTWMEKSPRFEKVILDIQKQEVSGNLSLQHHMLEPVQRIPRYEMLLKDYLKKLPKDSPDWGDAHKALEIIFEAAQHSNAAIADMERLEKLWEVYALLGMGEEMVDPSNRLLREGPVLKISFRKNTPKEGHLFLFSNMLLYCVPRFSLTGARFLIKAQVDMEEMQVREMKDAEIPHSFLVCGTSCTLEFRARSQSDMEAWTKAIEGAIEQSEKKSESFKAAVSSPSSEEQKVEVVEQQELGKRAPQWIRDSLVSMCMRCGDKFNALIRRRHHCRACGQVVCWRCSDFKAALQYDSDRVNRVCRDCYAILVGQPDGPAVSERKRGILEVREGGAFPHACAHRYLPHLDGSPLAVSSQKEAGEVSERSLVCSFLTMIDRQGKTRGWFVIPRDEPPVLYMYQAPQVSGGSLPARELRSCCGRLIATALSSRPVLFQDVRAQVTIPLLGYRVKELSPSDKRTFQLSQSNLLLTFLAESEELRDRWVEVISRVVDSEYPGQQRD